MLGSGKVKMRVTAIEEGMHGACKAFEIAVCYIGHSVAVAACLRVVQWHDVDSYLLRRVFIMTE